MCMFDTYGYDVLKFSNVFHDSVDRLLSLRFLQGEEKNNRNLNKGSPVCINAMT